MATFAAVVEAGSFTCAADVLALPKARVSQRVSDLERYLGVQLLRRTTRVVAVTEEGAQYLVTCKRILQDVEEAEDALKVDENEMQGRLRVECLLPVARWILAPRIQEFQQSFPNVAVRLSASDRLSHLLEDSLDCAIRGGALPDTSHRAYQVCDVRVGLYASPTYIGKFGTPDEPSGLVQHRRLTWFDRVREPFKWRLEAGEKLTEVPATLGLRFDDAEVAMASCLAGSGICPAAPFAVVEWVKSGRLVPVLPEWAFAARPISVLYPGTRKLAPRVRRFADWATELIRDQVKLYGSPQDLLKNL